MPPPRAARPVVDRALLPSAGAARRLALARGALHDQRAAVRVYHPGRHGRARAQRVLQGAEARHRRVLVGHVPRGGLRARPARVAEWAPPAGEVRVRVQLHGLLAEPVPGGGRRRLPRTDRFPVRDIETDHWASEVPRGHRPRFEDTPAARRREWGEVGPGPATRGRRNIAY